ncbi:MAG: hypothetical protein C4547_06110 [Phycisphaerales bacterium]|nr:MAG: hypothetical protein C4547_06110 [Phycisphaerales bacterium]
MYAVGSASPARAAEVLSPVADGTILDGGIFGLFDGLPDDWDWTFNDSGYEGSITRTTTRPESSLEHRVVWEYDLRGLNLQPPIIASLTFEVRGATVFPLPDSPVAVFAYPADLIESKNDYNVAPTALEGVVKVKPLQPTTSYAMNVSRTVEEAIRAGRQMVAFRIQIDPATPNDRNQAFIDALDAKPETKPRLSVRIGKPFDDDGDGDVDLDDYAGFSECLSGPQVDDLPGACHVHDVDGDEDVDAVDTAGFQLRFTGPQ